MSNPYLYSTLIGDASFRTIEVLPGQKADPMRCHILCHSSPSATTYEALSYAWGNPILSHSIFIEDKELKTTTNLHSAFVRLRDKKESRILWADAVCINQGDANEKPGQIRLMRQIYHKAQRVIAYLGEAADNSQEIYDLMGPITLIAFNRQHRLCEEEYEESGLPPRSHSTWRAFHQLFRRAWFTRYWVIQEIILGREVDLICGEWVLPFKLFTRYIIRGAILELPFTDTRANNEQVGMAQLMRISQLLDSGSNSWKLIHLLRLFRLARASNDHDYIYAILGIAAEANDSALTIDYTESAEDTFLRFAKYFVTQGDGVQLLYSSHLKSAASTLPSWVPNWATKDLILSSIAPDPIWDRVSQFSAGGESQASISLKPSSNDLIVRGIIFDRLFKIGKIHEKDPNDQSLGSRMCEVQYCMEELHDLFATFLRYPSGGDPGDAKWRTLMCNTSTGTFGQLKPPREYAQGFKALEILVDGLRNGKSLVLEEADLYFQQAKRPVGESLEWCYSKRRAVTVKGYLAKFRFSRRPGMLLLSSSARLFHSYYDWY
ncbi:HET-domain-containing protein [Hyaloscypha bicolor E]|uniref:HET-domain-containing protein n=1 Tax=Hyaloscypha bicolor E TaxID=1095630 RepID=A0A2J6T4X5_9HELO|nr:HET-domain-containing protein [Hyaloscypha bicolor E]PMD58068.1 HET-domain-containing protein [Hyaloscypha bicolor E]